MKDSQRNNVSNGFFYPSCIVYRFPVCCTEYKFVCSAILNISPLSTNDFKYSEGLESASGKFSPVNVTVYCMGSHLCHLYEAFPGFDDTACFDYPACSSLLLVSHTELFSSSSSL